MSSRCLTWQSSTVSEARFGAGLAGGEQAEVVEAESQEDIIRETARLFLRNLPYTATESDLAAAFGEHGELSEVHVVLDRYAAKSLPQIIVLRWLECALVLCHCISACAQGHGVPVCHTLTI